MKVVTDDKKNYHRGRKVPVKWIFGGFNLTTKLGFLTLVSDRRALTLFPILQECVADDTIIWSDEWAAYYGNGALSNRYQHDICPILN